MLLLPARPALDIKEVEEDEPPAEDVPTATCVPTILFVPTELPTCFMLFASIFFSGDSPSIAAFALFGDRNLSSFDADRDIGRVLYYEIKLLHHHQESKSRLSKYKVSPFLGHADGEEVVWLHHILEDDVDIGRVL